MTSTMTVRKREAARARLTYELEVICKILNPNVEALRGTMRGPALAWTQENIIWLNQGQLPNDPQDKRNLAVWLGAAYHELGHVFFTPREGTPLFDKIKQATTSLYPDAFMIFNAIEDQRQERLMISRFRPLRAYLTTLVVEMIVKQQGIVNEASWMLFAGRTWIDPDVRRSLRNLFSSAYGEEAAAEVKALIAEYQRLADPADADAQRAFAIVGRLSEILRSPDVDVPTPQGCGAPDTSREAGGSIPAEAPDEDDPLDDEEGAGEAENNDTSEDEEQSTDLESSTEDGDDEDGESAKSEAGDDSHSSDTSPNDGDDGDGQASSAFDITEALQEAAQEMLKDEDVRKDLASVGASLGAGKQQTNVPASFQFVEPREDDIRASLLAADVLRDLRAEIEPGWKRRESSGKLATRRVMGSRYVDPEEAYDLWSDGEVDEVSTEIVVLLDTSGSMVSHFTELSGAAWALHQAMDAAEVDLSVYVWGSQHRLFISKDERPTPMAKRVPDMGGTTPADVLREAWEVLRVSEAEHRICLVMTDGAWYGYEGDRGIELLNEEGIETVLAYFSNSPTTDTAVELERHHRHEAKHFKPITSVVEIPEMLEGMVKDIMEGARK